MCDTFIALQPATEDGSIIFGKNSDREANEAQSLEYHPPKSYSSNSKIKCTYINIPQVERINGIIISRPFWMWGAEMGVNEKGVVIGNEAVFTKMKVSKNNVLTGMDLLRLGLERADSAENAKQIIIDLLKLYGQGGVCGYVDKGMFYHNSFIIADKIEAFILETAGEFWVTKKVEKYYAISNGLTIGSDYDEIHPKAVDYARKKGWVKGDFHFTNAFSDFLYTTFSACKARQNRADKILKNNFKSINVPSAMAHLRDHNSIDFNPTNALLGKTICAHAGNSITRNASQTTSSMLVHLTKDKPTIWITATSAPCISMFKPIWFENSVIPSLGENLGTYYNENSFWWNHELLHRQILKDYSNRKNSLILDFQNAEKEVLDLVLQNNKKGFSISEIAFEKHKQIIEKNLPIISNLKVKNKPNIYYSSYFKKLNKKAKIPI